MIIMAEESSVSAGPMPIRLKTLKREEFTINLDEASSVSDLKKKIQQEKKDLFQLDSSGFLQLVCAGKVLKDDEQVKSVYDPKNKAAFMVVIAKRLAGAPPASSAAENKPAAAADSKTEDGAQQKPKSTATAVASAASSEATNPPPSSAVVGGQEGTANPHQQALQQNETLIKNIIEMGYPRAHVEQALILSQFNGDRAVQLLCDGMPLGVGAMGGAGGGVGGNAEDVDLEFDPNDPAAAALFAAAAAAGGGADDDDDDDDEEGAAGGGIGGGQGLEFLRHLPQFEQMRQLVSQNPAMLPQLIQQIGTSNPELLHLIQSNQEEFIQLINSSAQPAAAGGAAAGGAQIPGAASGPRRDNRVVINLTQQDRDAIDRLKNMGFEEALVVQAYFACDRDENAAANFLLSQLQDD